MSISNRYVLRTYILEIQIEHGGCRQSLLTSVQQVHGEAGHMQVHKKQTPCAAKSALTRYINVISVNANKQFPLSYLNLFASNLHYHMQTYAQLWKNLNSRICWKRKAVLLVLRMHFSVYISKLICNLNLKSKLLILKCEFI